MRHVIVTAALAAVLWMGAGIARAQEESPQTWGLKADIIEACSCHLMCCCYFRDQPEGGEMCRFNSAFRVSTGHVGDVNLDGARFWLSGDLGGDFSAGKMKEMILTVDPSVTAEQRKAVRFLVDRIFPVRWDRFETAEEPITWEQTDTSATARLGDVAEITLTPARDKRGSQTVIENLTYWGAQKNDGFHLARSVHRYRGFGLDYAFEGRNGFTIRIESSGVMEQGKQ